MSLSNEINKWKTVKANPILEFSSFHKLNDEFYGGIDKYSLNIIVANTGFGKSMFSINLALDYAVAGYKVVLFSTELTHVKVMDRLVTLVFDLTIGEIKKIKEDYQGGCEKAARRIEEIEKTMGKLQIKVFAETNIEKIRLKIGEIKESEGLDVAFIDHIHDVDVNNEQADRNDTAKTKYIINDVLPDVWKKEQVCLFCVVQFRKGDDDGQRILDDIKGAGDIGTKASNIFYLYQTKKQSERNKEFSKMCNLQILKARDGVKHIKHEMEFIGNRAKFNYKGHYV